MIFEIKKVMNGNLVIIKENSEDDGEHILVSRDGEDEETDVEAFAMLLRELNDAFGPMTSRYSKKRIYVEVKEGDKYEKN